MMITRKAMGRRTVLRGMGTTVALPLLEAMGSSASAVETAAASRKRLQVIYTPNGMVMKDFFPAQTGEGYAMSPILKPLEPYRDRFAVVSGLDHIQAEALGDGAGDHARCCGTFLTGVHVKKTDGASHSYRAPSGPTEPATATARPLAAAASRASATPVWLITATCSAWPWLASRKEFAPKVLVSIRSAPACR